MKIGQLSASNKPTTLYHGSGFEQDELKPGFMHTGKVVSWDNYENNTYLYATTDRDSALTLGFSSAIEKKYDLKHTHIDNKAKTIRLKFDGHVPERSAIEKIKVYLYTLPLEPFWVKNNNPFNNIETEYKTKEVVKTILERVRVDIPALLREYQLSLS